MLSRLVRLTLAAAALALPAAAQAGGTWVYGATQNDVDITWNDDAGNPAYFTVFQLPVSVESATGGDGQTCETPFEGDATKVECQVTSENRFAWRGPGRHGHSHVHTRDSVPCGSSFHHRVSEDNSTYKDEADITGPSCPTTGGGGG